MSLPQTQPMDFEEDDTQPFYDDDAAQQPPNKPKGDVRWYPRDGGEWFPAEVPDRQPPRQQLRRRAAHGV